MEAKALTTQDLTTEQGPETGQDLAADERGADLAHARLTALSLVTASQAARDLEIDDLQIEELAAEAVAIIEDGGPAADGLPFGQFGVAEPITAALGAAGITRAFPIQALTLPIALDRPLARRPPRHGLVDAQPLVAWQQAATRAVAQAVAAVANQRHRAFSLAEGADR